jgi:murein DD-endopeptidase MepM/ murein hydrolase activator NlpD
MRGRLLVLVVLGLAIVAAAAVLAWRQSAPGVDVTLEPLTAVGLETPIRITVEAARGEVAAVEVRLVQDDRAGEVLRRDVAGQRVELEAMIEGRALGLAEGPATLEVRAGDDFWRPLGHEPTQVRVPVTVDLTPPALSILAVSPAIAQGGSGIVAYRATGAVTSEVRVSDRGFPSLPAQPGEDDVRLAMIGLPWDIAPDTPLAIHAADAAGNTAVEPLPIRIRRRRFPETTVDLNDGWLATVVAALLPERPADQSLIDAFLVINREQRQASEARKRELAADPAAEALWQGPFLHPQGTQVFSRFAETRIYRYGGKAIDRQVHVGYDLASVREAPAAATNHGRVIFAGLLGIYGNTVVIDHGFGLMTLFGHLSRIEVAVGDRVEKGQRLGRTGTTGLAAGDHLHYEVMVHGVPVTPLEWWDGRWIAGHIWDPVRAAGLPALGAPPW